VTGALAWHYHTLAKRRSLGVVLSNCPAIWDDDAKPDGIIDGREGGLAPGNLGGDWPIRASYAQKSPPLIFQNDTQHQQILN
jgi:hypothetical protein